LRRSKPGLYGDGNNLFLQVSASKTNSKQINRSWIFRYTTSGRAIDMGLGSLNILGLKDARELAREYCALRLRGVDPLQHRNAQRATAAAASMKSTTFEAAAHAYIAAHRDEWRSQQSHQTCFLGLGLAARFHHRYRNGGESPGERMAERTGDRRSFTRPD